MAGVKGRSGGSRVGSGRKPVDDRAGNVTGSRRARARAKQKAAASASRSEAGQSGDGSAADGQPVVAAVVIPQPPGSLTLDELAEWNDLAPLAAKHCTLDLSTSLALRDLCQLRVLKDRLLRRIGDDGDVVLGAGGQLAAHPLLTRITTLSQRIEAGMARFKLSPTGKALESAAPPTKDPFAEFDMAGEDGREPVAH